MDFTIWKIFGIIAIILLIIFWRKRGAVWGGMTIGAIIGLIMAIIFIFKGNKFDWHIIGKGAALGTIIGFIAELLGKISNLIKKK